MSYKIQLTEGDTEPWSLRLYDAGADNTLEGATVTLDMYDANGDSVIADGACDEQPGITFTADASTDKLTAVGHKLKDGWEVIASNSGGGLPGGLAASTRYFVLDATPNNLKLSLEPEGEAIDITSAGTGTHTLKVIGQVQYTPSASLAAGTYRAWLTKTVGSAVTKWPNTKEGIVVEIVEVP